MLEHWLWLAHRPGINEHLKVLLLQFFGSPEQVYSAGLREYASVPGLTAAGKKALSDKAAMDLRLKRRGYIKYVPSMLAACIGLILTLFLPSEIKVYGVSVTAVFTTILTAVINIFQGNDKSKQRFSDYYGKFLVCPHCGKILTEKEFQMQMCAVCKAHS